MNTSVRPYAVTDKAACLALFDSNVPRYFDASERPGFVTFLNEPGGDYFVIEQDGTICGCGGFSRAERGQACFTWGMVDNARHGSGLGRLLAEYRLRAIEASGVFEEAELFTTPQIAPFFAKFGFEKQGVEKDGFAPGMDKVQMIKKLKITQP
ncbi:GNAT family N-acetyltransferase [Parasphingorhabdus litoris]|uniref:GNAT family N-acetyltransferase n=1 Tax=Parasphingorhabdus litoris TaxID=394733 RepID=A0ABP3KDS5_9SPHN|nr:GNAT family N-acetyltransferase [Parasphingorhabdus litoris]